MTKDEPIQIGIIEIDEQGKIIGEYKSLIKPDKKTDELKQIVWFITGLSIGELDTAPTREEVLAHIENFFWENTIIIWHNIKFDIDFLEKYFPSLTHKTSIDTMHLAQTTIHYAQSYALDVLIEKVKDDKIFSQIFKDNDHGEEKAHDAFFDTKNSSKLFLYFVKYLYELLNSYPNLIHIILQTESVRKEILVLENYKDIVAIKIQFPALERIAPSNTNMAKSNKGINTDDLENQKKYYIGDIDIKQLLSALAENKNLILAFQNIQKLDIAKTVLNDMGVKNIGFTKEEQTINQKSFQKFLNKWSFIQEEMFFVIKYLSHLKKWLGLLNLNSPYDYKIYYYIKDTRNQTKYPIILTTHHGLFTTMKDNQETFKDYDVCFFDVENRYKGYNFFLSSPIDLYYTLNILESFMYQQHVEQQINRQENQEADKEKLASFVNLFQTFIGILFMESKKLFIKTEATMTQHDPIRDHGDFYQTNLLWKQLIEKETETKEILSEENKIILEKHRAHITKVFDNVVNIFKKTYGNGEFYFTYSESQKYTDRKEFVDEFKNKVIFLSNTGKQFEAITKNTNTLKNNKIWAQNIISLPRIKQILEHIQTQQETRKNYGCFIFSPKKEESKKIFEDLCENSIQNKATLLVENITGGVGKNLFKAKQTKNKIIIWWFNFILFLYANKIPLDDIIIFNAKWPSEQNILNDIKRYNTTQ